MLRKNFPGRKLKRREAAEARAAAYVKKPFEMLGEKERRKLSNSILDFHEKFKNEVQNG